jgi:hypothetical protein
VLDFVFVVICCHLLAAFELRRLEIFWKVNFDQAVVIAKNRAELGFIVMKGTEYYVSL